MSHVKSSPLALHPSPFTPRCHVGSVMGSERLSDSVRRFAAIVLHHAIVELLKHASELSYLSGAGLRLRHQSALLDDQRLLHFEEPG